MLFLGDATCGCGVSFAKRSPHHKFCSDRCRYRYHDSHNPNHIANNRLRCQRWAAANRGVKRAQPWLVGPPPYEAYLPAAGVSISVSPNPKWPMVLRNTRALHGLMTALTDKPHLPNYPRWALVPLPTQFGWGALFDDPADGERLAGKHMSGVLFDNVVDVRLGALTRVKNPVITKRGRRLVRVDCLTPAIIRNSGKVSYTSPSAENVKCSLAQLLRNRVGLVVDPDTLCMDLVKRETSAVNVVMGGKYPNVGAFTGGLLLECNAVAHWALKVAESYGFGSKVAFGYGRIRVSDG